MPALGVGTTVRIKTENGETAASVTPSESIRDKTGIIQGTHSGRVTTPIGEDGIIPEYDHFTYYVSVEGGQHIIDQDWLESA